MLKTCDELGKSVLSSTQGRVEVAVCVQLELKRESHKLLKTTWGALLNER